ncbi:hypothetical protein D3C71_1166900 [compost metagenome]
MPERCDGLGQLGGLFLQLAGGGAGFFDQCRVLLGGVIHLRHGLVDLVDAAGLFLRGRRDLGHDAADRRHAADDLGHGLAGILGQVRAVGYLQHRGLDQALDLLGGLGRAMCQGAHFAGHHCEPAALLARTCCFHGRVEGQDVGLEGDPVDDAGDVADPPRRDLDGLHGGHDLAYHRAAAACHVLCAVRQRAGLARMFGVLAHGGGELLHRGGGLFQVRGLALGAFGQVTVATGDLAGGLRDRAGALLDTRDHGGELFGGGIGIALHGGERAVELAVHALVQVPAGQCRQHAAHFAHGAAHALQQLVDAAGEAVEEAGRTLDRRQASVQVALGGRSDDVGHGSFQLQFGGAVMPLHRKAEALAMLIEHRCHHLGEMHRPDPHPAVVHLLQRVEDAADAVGVHVETMDAATNQRVDVEVGECLAQARLLVAQQRHHRAVHVADHVVVVGDHHRGARDIQRTVDLRVFAVHRRGALLLLGQGVRGGMGPLQILLPAPGLSPATHRQHAQQHADPQHRQQQRPLPLPERGTAASGQQQRGRHRDGAIQALPSGGRPGGAGTVGWARCNEGKGRHGDSGIQKQGRPVARGSGQARGAPITVDAVGAAGKTGREEARRPRAVDDEASTVRNTAGTARSCGRWHGQHGIATTFPEALE